MANVSEPAVAREALLSNVLMVAAVLLFGVLAVQEIIGLLQG